jgi:hypothetical protein
MASIYRTASTARGARATSADATSADWREVSPPLHRLEVFTDLQRAAQQRMRKPIWDLYTDLELYRCHPGQSRRRTLRAL